MSVVSYTIVPETVLKWRGNIPICKFSGMFIVTRLDHTIQQATLPIAWLTSPLLLRRLGLIPCSLRYCIRISISYKEFSMFDEQYDDDVRALFFK